MSPYYADDLATVYLGDALEILADLPTASVDSVVTDPPYGLAFMGKAWDHLPPGVDWARECLRVLKPGGHLLAFGGTRTWHRLAVAVEDAGFEIRDSIAWLYGQGFPKGKGQLKPAFEPVILARKPLSGTTAANVLEHGTGALNIDDCRIETADDMRRTRNTALGVMNDDGWRPKPQVSNGHPLGRWPANVVLDDTAAAELDEQSGTLSSWMAKSNYRIDTSNEVYGKFGNRPVGPQNQYGDSGGASRFFPVFRYNAKAPTKERPKVNGVAHPTVKPLGLMRWLVRLVTPPNGTVLDPFAGSGATIEAAILEGFRTIGIEREAAYLPLIQVRLDRVTEEITG